MSLSKTNISCYALLLALIFSMACKQEKPAETPAQTAQKTFASPDDAAKALVDAAKSGNRDAMLAIFGPGSAEIIYSGDAEARTRRPLQDSSRLRGDAPLAQTRRR